MRFSVIMPVYNKAATLSAAVSSVLAQTFEDYELIIVNDGSTDDFESVATELKKEKCIRIISQENGGVSVARNTGISKATGEFVCFLDADDLYTEDHLEVLNDLIERYREQSFFATSHMTSYPDGKESRSSDALSAYPDDFLCENLFLLLNTQGDGIINTNCMCISRELLLQENIRFEAGEKIGEDTDLWFRVALRHPIVLTKRPTNVYRREYSTATAKTSNTLSWKFARRLDEIKAMDIPPEKKAECIKLVDRYKMACSRDLLAVSDKRGAKQILKTVEYRTAKYVVSRVLCMLPLALSRRVVDKIRGH